MALKITKVEVWAGDIDDQPGGLAEVLETVADGGAALECVIARRKPDQPGSGVVFLTPIKGAATARAARSIGLSRASDIATLRIEGPDKKGLGAQITGALAADGINIRGVSAMTLGRNFVAYIGFDSAADATKAAKAIQSVDRPATRKKATKKTAKKRSR